MPSRQELELVLNQLGVSEGDKAQLLRLLDAPRAVLYCRETDRGTTVGGGEILRALRIRSGKTQSDTARAVGVTRQMLSQWERGDHWPDAQMLHRLCLIVGATVEETLFLTTREFIAHEPLPTDRESLRDLHVKLTFQSTAPSKELDSLVLAARFGEAARNDLPVALSDQAAVWGTLAFEQANRFQNYALAQQLGSQVLTLMTASRRWFGSSQLRGIIALARAEATLLGPEHGLSRLDPYHDRVCFDDLHAWLHAEQARYLFALGEHTQAIQLGRLAVAEAQPYPVEHAARQRDLETLMGRETGLAR